MRRLVLFDLDDTLLAGDSDYQWSQMLIETGVLDRRTSEARNLEFYEKYKAGVLDVSEFLEFQLRPLARHPRAQLDAWHAQFMTSRVLPMVRPGARPLIARHGDALTAIITATNRFVTAPIAQALGVANLLATELEEIDGRFTGREKGTPCYREGKVTRLEEWLASRGERLAEYEESWFYTDSINDLPLLSSVTHPVAAHPDDRLRAHAEAHGWPIVSLD
jgi:HAD superfamily hydrolase (TIGR01490 family)